MERVERVGVDRFASGTGSQVTAQYVLGIDLGTTNSVLAYAPLDGDAPKVELLKIPQLVDGNTVDDAFKKNRRKRLLTIYDSVRPDIVMLEAYPFGRRQLRFELLPLIEAIEASAPKPILVTSLGDV